MSPTPPTGSFASATAGSRSLAAQSLDRRQLDRPPRGIERADQADTQREREPPGEDAGRELGLGEAGKRAVVGEQHGGRPPAEQPEPECDQAEPERFADDQW